ncbi:MAG TPA: LysR family transcriptional regulator [Rhizomicrobium sp.]|nr:LysR family transcriptional regulator [Rhizomicrobium sp.]
MIGDRESVFSSRVAGAPVNRILDQSQKRISRSPLDDPRVLSGPFWAELRVFLAVAKAKSFNRAGEELHISRQTISRDILRLQDQLGAVLLIPSKSGVQLTEKGKELADKLLSLDQILFSMSNDLRAESREAEGNVRITATEALTAFFIVPSAVDFSQRYPKIRTHLRNPVDLLDFRENQCDVMVGFGSLRESDLTSRPVGFLHLIGAAAKPYLAKSGVPTWDTLDQHRFIDADYYASQTDTYAPWRNAVARGITAHRCDNSISYGLMVRAGMGIGLVGNFIAVADPDLVPVGLGIHVKLPLFVHAQTERLKSRPVRLVYDWLCEVFSLSNPLFSREFNPKTAPPQLMAQTLRHLSMGSSLLR